MTTTPSSFKVLLFGVLKDLARNESIVVIAPDEGSEISVSELLQLVALQHPALARYLPHVRVAVNCEYANGDESVRPEDEVALIPPVAGG